MSKIVGPDGMEIEKEIVEREVPDKLVDKIKDKQDKGNQLMNNFVNVALRETLLVQEKLNLVEKIKNNKQGLDAAKKNAYTKMKLNDEKDYTWQYHTDGKFIGIPRKKKE